ncbi:hypothetical protein MKX01_026608, partial [Papaver californicum]
FYMCLILFIFLYMSRKSFFHFSLLSKFFFFGLIGAKNKHLLTLAQNFAFMGLSYNSPIGVATMANQLPDSSFLLSMVLRCGHVEFRRSSTQAKSIGTVVSIVGTTFVTMYKGPTLWKPSTYQLFLSSSPRPLFLFGSTPESWVLGCILLAITTLCVSTVQGWCMRTKGPLFIAMFEPFTVFIAVCFGYLFFGHTFHFESGIGSFIAAIGYYCSMWGQVKEVEENQISQYQNGSRSSKSYDDNDQSCVTIKKPILQDQRRVLHEEVQKEKEPLS